MFYALLIIIMLLKRTSSGRGNGLAFEQNVHLLFF